MKNFKLKSFPDPSLSKEGRKNFMRKVEDFKCEQCGFEVVGDGYTDHCPVCLWGKHVDFEIPGDRLSDCKGLMKPMKTEYKQGKFKIKYKCTKCRHEFWVRENDGDDREKLMELCGII
jgi:ribosomal protein L37AE/L43A